jgi:CRP-like cAMP-binding protein
LAQQVSHSLVQTLRRIPDFSTLDEETLLRVVGESMNLFWRAGSTIFEPGTPGEALYVVIRGEVAIRGANGTEVARPKPGSFFGEMSLLLNATHSKEAVAIKDCELMVVPKEAFGAMLKANPDLAEHFDKVLRSHQEAPAASC